MFIDKVIKNFCFPRIANCKKLDSGSKNLYIFKSFLVLYATQFPIYIKVTPTFASVGQNSEL